MIAITLLPGVHVNKVSYKLSNQSYEKKTHITTPMRKTHYSHLTYLHELIYNTCLVVHNYSETLQHMTV